MTRFLPGFAPPITVSELNRRAREVLEGEFDELWIAGELSNVKFASSGHWYFCLKDAEAAVDCAMFRGRAQFLDFRPADGAKVEARARVTLYEPRGKYQLVVEELRVAGRGALHEAFEKLKAKLDAEGLFDAGRKRALPSFPRAIGLVTSPAAAALRDILTTLARRAPMVPVILYPARVQGEDAAATLARALASANARREVDVIIVARGGGSLEDLWAFNEEVLARAIVASAIPVVSGVGHETDFTIADFVADLRAPTPTAAAAAASPDREALQDSVAGLRRRLARDMRRIVETHAQRLDGLARRLLTPAQHVERSREGVALLARRLRQVTAANLELKHVRLESLARRLARPEARLAAGRQRLEDYARALRGAAARGVELRALRLDAKRASLAHLDPTRVLARGYSIVRRPDGEIVRSSAALAPEDALGITFSEGSAGVRVVKTEKSV